MNEWNTGGGGKRRIIQLCYYYSYVTGEETGLDASPTKLKACKRLRI